MVKKKTLMDVKQFRLFELRVKLRIKYELRATAAAIMVFLEKRVLVPRSLPWTCLSLAGRCRKWL